MVVDIVVDGGHPHHHTEGQAIIDAGCHLSDVRSDGVTAMIPPWDMGMRGGHITLTVDRWHGADCVFVNAPVGVVMPQSDARTGRVPLTLPLLALAAALGWFATTRRLAPRTARIGRRYVA